MVWLSIVLALAQQPTRLEETPEWRRARDVVASAPQYRVTFRAEARGIVRDSGGSLTVKDHRQFVLESDNQTVYWDGVTATYVDRETNKITTSTIKPSLGHFEFLMVEAAGPQRDELYILTRLSEEEVSAVGEGGKSELLKLPAKVGWKLQLWGDHGAAAAQEFWYDPKTGLLSQAVEFSKNSWLTYRCEYDLTWNLKPNVPDTFFVPTPFPSSGANLWKHEHIEMRPMRAQNMLPSGRLTVRLPEGVHAAVDIRRDQVERFVLEGTGDVLQADLPPGVYQVTLGVQPLMVLLRADHESRIRVGGVLNRGKEPVEVLDADWKLCGKVPAGKAEALLAGTYFVRTGQGRKQIVVKEGAVTRF